MNTVQQAIIDRLKEAFCNAVDFIDCKNCIHYEKYWNCGQGDGVCSQCVMKDDGVYYEEAVMNTQQQKGTAWKS